MSHHGAPSVGGHYHDWFDAWCLLIHTKELAAMKNIAALHRRYVVAIRYYPNLYLLHVYECCLSAQK